MTEWTARICTGFWLAALCAKPRKAQETNRSVRCWKILWALGAVALLVHTAVAFHSIHNWSHDLAYAHTAKQTLDKLGIDWGGGLYFNYLTMVWWGIDALAVCLKFNWANKRTYRLATEWYLAFMFINATIVFGPRFWLAISGAFFIALWYVRSKTRKLD